MLAVNQSVVSIWLVLVWPVPRLLALLSTTAASLALARASAPKAACEKPSLFWQLVPVPLLPLASMKRKRPRKKARTRLAVSDAGLVLDPAVALDLRCIPTLPVIQQA